MTIANATLERALDLHRQGRLAEATTAYQDVLAGDPLNVEALHLLGLVMASAGRGEDAVGLMSKAAELQPSNAAMWANLGIALCDIGRYAEAVASFDRAVALQPDLTSAYLGRGAALMSLGRLEAALANLGQALRLSPKDARAHNSLGVALERANRTQEALHCFRQALDLDPGNAEAHHNAGLVFAALGRHTEALASIERALALQPQQAIAHTNRGTQLLALNRPAEALASFDRALGIQPNEFTASHNRGLALMSLERHAEALASFDRALALAPDSAPTHLWRAKALVGLERPAEALASLERRLMLAPPEFETHFQRGVALAKLERYEESVSAFDKALALDSRSAEALNNRGAVLVRLFRPAEAVEDLVNAVICRPDYADAYINAGNAHRGLGRFQEALRNVDRALSLRPNDATATWSKAVLKLALGEFQEGWPLYEARFRLEHAIAQQRGFRVPRWSGTEPLRGKTLFVHSEQGLGDTLQFCRYIPLLDKLGAKVVFEVQPQLKKIMGSLDASATIVGRGEQIPQVDLHIPLLSLPLAVGTELNTIPGGVPYLKVGGEATNSWMERLAALPGLRIGLNWHGNPEAEKHSAMQARSFPLSAAAALARLPGVSLISLQKGPGAEQRGTVEFGATLVQLADPMRMDADELADETAAILMGLDLVVTADTALAHLAGALGVPVWVILQSVPDWRWLIGRADSPWYPTMRLFRQRKPGDWKEVLDRVAGEIGIMQAGAHPR